MLLEWLTPRNAASSSRTAPEWLGPLAPTYNYRCFSKPRALGGAFIRAKGALDLQILH